MEIAVPNGDVCLFKCAGGKINSIKREKGIKCRRNMAGVLEQAWLAPNEAMMTADDDDTEDVK